MRPPSGIHAAAFAVAIVVVLRAPVAPFSEPAGVSAAEPAGFDPGFLSALTCGTSVPTAEDGVFKDLSARLDAELAKLEALQSGDLASFDRDATAAGLAPLKQAGRR